MSLWAAFYSTNSGVFEFVFINTTIARLFFSTSCRSTQSCSDSDLSVIRLPYVFELCINRFVILDRTLCCFVRLSISGSLLPIWVRFY